MHSSVVKYTCNNKRFTDFANTVLHNLLWQNSKFFCQQLSAQHLREAIPVPSL